MSRTRLACLACGAGDLEPILDLGRQPLANALRPLERLDEPEPAYPLELVLCPACSLVQITETVPPEVLFRDYVYFSSFSDAMLKHAETLAADLTAGRKLGGGSLVIEVASNDGYLLQFYKRAGVPVLGIEPARNIAKWAEEERGIPTICEFFGVEVASRLAAEGRKADVVHMHNVLAHVADLNGVVEGVRTILRDDGVAVIEAPYLGDMIAGCEFDTIYHEHLCYFSLTALDRLFRGHALELRDVKRVPIHGGSLRLTVGHAGRGEASRAVGELLDEERAWGVNRIASYQPFARRVESLKASLLGLLAGLKAQGKRLAAYGASAKGSTLLNYFGIGRETLNFVADRSTVKQGLYTPGSSLPIVGPEALLNETPDFTLLLTWNFAEEILRQQAEYRARGGRFIVPIPEVVVV
jgi:SAM-dependent methyltransferase